MVRKILIIFALIIAAFPYLGFSDTADLVVTTVFSLLIALALILGKKPKTIKKQVQDSNFEIQPRQETPVVVSQPQEMKVSHSENETVRNMSFVSDNRENNVIKINNESIVLHDQPVVERQVEAPVQKIRMPRKRAVAPKPTNIVQDTLMSEPVIETKRDDVPVENVMAIRKRQRKSISNTILAHEDSVPPADVPVRFE